MSSSSADPPLSYARFCAVHWAMFAAYLCLSFLPAALKLLQLLLRRRHPPADPQAGLRDSLLSDDGSSPAPQFSLNTDMTKRRKMRLDFWRVVFHASFTLGAVTRAGYFAYCAALPDYRERSGGLMFMLNHVGTFLFFACYYVVLAYWIEAYHGRRARTEPPMYVRSRASAVLGAVTAVSLLAFVGFGIADAVIKDDPGNPSRQTRQLHRGFMIMTGMMYLALALLYAVYGILMTRKFVRTTMSAATKSLGDMARNVLARVALQAIICVVCFGIRASLLLWTLIPKNAELTNTLWWFDIAYWGSLEVVPLVIMLALLRQRRALKDRVSTSRRVGSSIPAHILRSDGALVSPLS